MSELLARRGKGNSEIFQTGDGAAIGYSQQGRIGRGRSPENPDERTSCHRLLEPCVYPGHLTWAAAMVHSQTRAVAVEALRSDWLPALHTSSLEFRGTEGARSPGVSVRDLPRQP